MIQKLFLEYYAYKIGNISVKLQADRPRYLRSFYLCIRLSVNAKIGFKC